ncbi:MAG TPA: TonB-dependent receptor [Bryobacteraceae bacterium]|nr:TonB-dependent receptor [Bryobacteraceae bacterium]
MGYRRLAVCALFSISLAAFAQSDRGSITGTITDSTGAVVPNAPVEIKNQDTGTVFQGGASATGNFIVANLPVGQYTLTVAVSGFKKYVRQNIQVTVAVDTRVDVNLEVGTAAETVTVSESTPLLKTESGELSHTVSTKDVDELPLMFIGQSLTGVRDPLAVLNVLPGTAFAADNVLQINGLPSNSEAIRVEGQDSTNSLWRQLTSYTNPGLDAIQEVSVQTSNFAAEYGQAAGGYLNFTMKSGTNQFHGSASDYMENEALNAGLPYTDAGITNSQKAGQHVRNKLRRNDYGFTIGGPIRIPKVYNGQNKSFFFVNFEQYRTLTGVANGTATVPTDAYRSGNFSTTTPLCVTVSAACPAVGGPTYATQSGALAKDGLGRPIPEYGVYDPLTSMQTPTGIVNNLFPNGQIPPSRFDPVAFKIQALLPEPTNGNLINNYNIPPYSNDNTGTTWSTKLDHSLSPTIKISGYYQQVGQHAPAYNGYNIGGSVAVSNAITGVEPTNLLNRTIRINYDQSLRPTLLLHIGAGLLYTYYPYVTSSYDQSQIGLHGFYANLFPVIGGITNGVTGGSSVPLGSGGAYGKEYDEKPTGNANLTWVKRNHTFKFGGELMFDGNILQSTYRSQGFLNFSGNETSDQWQGAQATALVGGSGFPYASFLLGMVDNFAVAPAGSIRLGNHSIGLYAQDSWKVTRKLTLDYGLRYDFQTYLREQYGRMQDANLYTPNPVVGGFPGVVLYEGNGPGHCNCSFSHNYPWAFGPRLGIAYQINSKTVFRGGAGIQYGTASNDAQLIISAVDFYSFGAPGYGLPAMPSLAAGNPYAAGNPFGNPTLTWPNTNPDKFPTRTICPGTANATCYTPQSPFIMLDKDARPPRVFTWSIGLQRELTRSTVVEAEYVGNRGVWFTAPALDVLAYNALNITDLSNFGLNLSNSADRSLLASTLNSPIAIQRGFGTPPYPGFPVTQTVEQALRPRPQWTYVPPFLGPPIGDTWYDSLQTKMTHRFSHGFTAQGSYTFSKSLVLGTNSDTAYLTAGGSSIFQSVAVNDVYNRNTNKELSGFSRPDALVFSGSYTVPKPTFGVLQNRYLSQIIRDWQIGAVLRYQNGALLEVPTSLNGIFAQLDRTGGLFSGGATYQNLTNGTTGLFTVDPNSHFDPTKQLVLNPASWADAPGGTFGVSAPYYNNFRWQRQPAESMNFARNFRVGKEGRYSLQVRVDFSNVFNRHFFSAPNLLYPTSVPTYNNALVQGGPAAGALSGGFGYVSFLNGAGDTPRTGQAVARFTF